MAPEHRDCISDLHTVIAPRIVTKRTTRGLTSVGADSVDHGINSGGWGVHPVVALHLRNAAEYCLPTFGPHGTKLGHS